MEGAAHASRASKRCPSTLVSFHPASTQCPAPRTTHPWTSKALRMSTSMSTAMSSPTSTRAQPSDAQLLSMEASTLVVEIDRLKHSIGKLRESNALLIEFEAGRGEGQEGAEWTQADRRELEQARIENDEVLSRQTQLLDRLERELTAKGGPEAAQQDPHLARAGAGGDVNMQ
ncbi:unnamed protein product [Parajaminaea phylloscopi]